MILHEIDVSGKSGKELKGKEVCANGFDDRASDEKNLDEKELKYRSSGKLTISNGEIRFEKDASFSTDTYYNSLSIGKWKKYCDIKEICLEIVFCGAFDIKLYQAVLTEKDRLEKREICTEKLEAKAETKVLLPINAGEGVVYFKIKALEDGAFIKKMAYIGACEKKNEVTLALNICTFKREKALFKNLALLKEGLLKNEKEELSKHLKVFITDNGKTIDPKTYEEENIFIFQNENLGGAGGFTRGLLEIRKRKEQERITHVIFMDDDIEFEIETIKRTYTLLCLLKKEYQEAFIAGAMLRLDKRYMQNENGAWWNYGGVILKDTNTDLRKFANVVKNEQFEKVEYAAWFYCCMPVDVISDSNLPLPLFIHGDDVEYGLRNAKHILTLNGIAVAHPVVAHKCVSSNSYYDLRNALIVNACHYHESYTKKAAKKRVIKDLLQVFLKYRYKDMYLIYLALEDFCRGPEWLYQLDSAAYHKKIQKMGYRFQNVSEQVKGKEDMAKDHEYTTGYMETFRQAKSLKGKLAVLLQIVSLNGWLLPAKDEIGVFYMNVRPMHMYRRKRVILYDEASMDGLVVEKSYKQLWIFLRTILKVSHLIDKQFAKSSHAYYNTIGKLCSVEYWDKRFHNGSVSSQL